MIFPKRLNLSIVEQANLNRKFNAEFPVGTFIKCLYKNNHPSMTMFGWIRKPLENDLHVEKVDPHQLVYRRQEKPYAIDIDNLIVQKATIEEYYDFSIKQLEENIEHNKKNMKLAKEAVKRSKSLLITFKKHFTEQFPSKNAK